MKWLVFSTAFFVAACASPQPAAPPTAPAPVPIEVPAIAQPDPAPLQLPPKAGPTVLASELTNITDLFVADAVYFVDTPHGLAKVPKEGGAVVTIQKEPHAEEGGPSPLAIEGGEVFWAPHTHGLWRQQSQIGNADVKAIAVDPDAAYVLEPDKQGATAQIVRYPRGKGAKKVLARQVYPAGLIAIDASNVYWTNTKNVRNDGAGEIFALGKSGGLPRTIHWDHQIPTSLRAHDDHVYFSTQYGLARVTKDGKDFDRLGPMPKSCYAPAIAVDDDNLYLACKDRGEIWRLEKKDGGEQKRLADQLSAPNAIAVDATHVYWTTPDGIARTAK